MADAKNNFWLGAGVGAAIIVIIDLMIPFLGPLLGGFVAGFIAKGGVMNAGKAGLVAGISPRLSSAWSSSQACSRRQ